MSLNNASREQWDYPNGWPPLTHLFVESLRLSRDEKLVEIAEKTAWKFIRTAYNGMMNPKKGMVCAVVLYVIMWVLLSLTYTDFVNLCNSELDINLAFFLK